MGGCNDGGRCVDMGGCNVDPPRRCNVGGCNVLISPGRPCTMDFYLSLYETALFF